MKIIDILNKIANEENPPKKIKYDLLEEDYQILVYDEEIQEYRYENDYKEFWHVPNHHLNDTVEILEEEKKIPEKLKLYEPYPEGIDTRFEDIEDKINEIIDYLKSKGE